MTIMKPFIDAVSLLKHKVPSPDCYPFSIPAIKTLTTLEIHPRLTFFVGENGSGKSTLLEAIAAVEDLNSEGGGRNFSFSTHKDSSILKKYIRLGRPFRPLRKTDAYYFRSESFFNLATELERLGLEYGDKSLHSQSHGEAFLSLIFHRFFGNGLYLLDEPESALSPLRQMAFLTAVHELIKSGSQLIIATHSPIIMAYPDSIIYRFSECGIEPIKYTDTDHYKIMKSFMNNHLGMLNQLIET